MTPQIQKVAVLGGGSAGFIAALTLKRMLPALAVTVVRSPDIGVIGVGEGTTPFFPTHLFQYLRLDPGQFYGEAQPTWKLGIRFLWGARPEFFYTFTNQFDSRWNDLPRPHGYYCDGDCRSVDLATALISAGKAFPRRLDGWPDFQLNYAFHIENKRLVDYLEARCREAEVQIVDDTVEQVERSPDGNVSTLLLRSGAHCNGDLFVDASGFRSELLGRFLGEPFISYENALFCNKAVIGGWARTHEPLLPYTTAETMNAGWCWQIEHESWVNRGYVYSSHFISDEQACEEFVNRNPKITTEPRIVRFRSGRYLRNWIGNVVAIGNASGFVEPLEATALSVIMLEARSLVDTLNETALSPSESSIALYNSIIGEVWDDVRDFLALHYRFNTRLNTGFWQACREETDLGRIKPLVRFYQENGPSGLARHTLPHSHNLFGLEGYFALLVGQKVPFQPHREVTPVEYQRWREHCNQFATAAQSGLTIEECLQAIRHPDWQWN